MYYQNYYSLYRESLVNNIAKAIDGEYSAIGCYQQIAKMAPTEEIRKQIMEIRQDEIKHFHEFSKIYTSLTGKKPSPQIKEPCPQEYRMAIEFALKDEQETVDFYLDIADSTQDPYMKETFKRAAADEQNHAVWFLYYFTKSNFR